MPLINHLCTAEMELFEAVQILTLCNSKHVVTLWQYYIRQLQTKPYLSDICQVNCTKVFVPCLVNYGLNQRTFTHNLEWSGMTSIGVILLTTNFLIKGYHELAC